MNKVTDITRWNRAGLRRIRYVGGNAATLLEQIRLRLEESFPGWGTIKRVALPGESEPEQQARLLAQYNAPRPAVPDWGWELARTLARAAHVLTEYIDAYANEAYLGTATQWVSLRRLVEMIDYYPPPPASAFTPLVVNAKPGASGKVGRGLAARYSPPDGSAPITFETLDDLDIDARLNAMRPRGSGEGSAAPLVGREVPLRDASEWLRYGRLIVARQEGGTAAPKLTRALGVRDGLLILADPLPVGSTVDNLVLHGNVVLAGHGERKPERVLGSGDATQTSQVFALNERDLSFVADAAGPSGVRADIEVKVEERTWTQVPSLRDSRPTDPHYTIRLMQDGELAVVFGDGRNGRRLPTGVNNVRGSFRVGAGPRGNLAAGRLTKLGRPHPLVESVAQPLQASGGNNMAGVESLRRSAPATVLALGRAVSTSDFASLARGHSSVWQARAFPGHSEESRHQRVEVVVVPAEGGELGPLEQTLADYLQARAVPGVEVAVTRYSSKAVQLDVTVEVDTRAYNPDAVVRAVKAALGEALSLRLRELGQPLYLSDVYKAVEAVSGVENSVCIMEGTPGLQRLDAPTDAHVIHLESEAHLVVRFQEYSL